MKLRYWTWGLLFLGMGLSCNSWGQSAEAQSSSADSEILGSVSQVRFEGLDKISESLVSEIVGIHPGDKLPAQELENSINDLRKWGVFSQVEVLISSEGEKLELIYDLKEGFLIRNVTIHGNYPLLEGKVRQALFLNSGSIYDAEKLPEQVERLVQLYDREGYMDTTVYAVENYDEVNREVNLDFRIKKGQTYRLRDYEIKGNDALNPKRIRTIIFTYSHYKPKTIKKDLQKIRDIYKKKGFVRARVRLEGEKYDYDLHKVDIEVLIRQGPQVRLEFEGNRRFWDKTLKKQVTIYEGGDYDEFELDASKKKLLRFYHERGFEDVRIEWRKNKINDLKYVVTFFVYEGPQRVVKVIDFHGNEQVKDDKLISRMATKSEAIGESGYYLQPLLEEDLKGVERYYREEGYLDAEIPTWNKHYSELGDKVLLEIQVNEGERAQVDKVLWEGASEAEIQELQEKMKIREGKPYSEYFLNQDVETLLVYWANHGHPYALVMPEVTELAKNHFQVRFKITPKTEVHIGKVLFVGNSKTQESVMRRNLVFKEGSLFSTQKLLQSQIFLRSLGIFDAVNLETLGLSSQKKIINVVVRVQEKKSKIFDFEAGYDTDRGFNGKFVFNKLNLFGHAKNGNVKLQLGQELSQFEINYIDPRFRGETMQLVSGVYGRYERRPFFRNKQAGAFGTVFKPFLENLSAFGRVDFYYVNFDQNNTVYQVLDPENTPQSQTRLTSTLGVTYDTRDSYGDPRRGIYASGTMALTDEFIQQNGHYLTLLGSVGHWYSPFRRLTFANALRVSKVFSFTDVAIPLDLRLYLGGEDTVRGFKQDSLLPSGGSFSLVHNFEMQFRIFSQFQVVGFVDSGVVVNQISDVNLSTLRHAAGFGLRYVTPVGPIRLDYGFVLDPEPSDSSRQRLNFSFGYFF